MRKSPILTALALLLLLAPACGSQAGPREGSTGSTSSRTDVESWARVLERHQERGGVDYAALKEDRSDLDAYLVSLEPVRPEALTEDEALAFWINAYNAVVVHHVLERYPGIENVKEVDGFFDEITFPVAGEELTLDQIEDRGIAIGDERIHFAVVCASTSCPDLRGEPYAAERLDAQLRDQTRTFLSDESKGLRYDPEDDVAWLSSIFKWYAGDFTGGSTVVAFFARGGVLEWVAEHAPEEIARTLEENDPAVRYMEYDWSLNDR